MGTWLHSTGLGENNKMYRALYKRPTRRRINAFTDFLAPKREDVFVRGSNRQKRPMLIGVPLELVPSDHDDFSCGFSRAFYYSLLVQKTDDKRTNYGQVDVACSDWLLESAVLASFRCFATFASCRDAPSDQ